MDLTTRCPHCGTTFAASLEQLQLRKGYIRCIQCAHIFDGYEAVVPAPATGVDPKPLKPQAASPASHSGQHAGRTPEPTIAPDAMPSVVRGRREFTISDRDAAGDTTDEPFWTVPPTAVKPEKGREHLSIDLDHIDIDADHGRIDPDHVRIEPDPVLTAQDHVVLGPREGEAAAHYNEMWREPVDDAPTNRWRSLVKAVWLAVIVAGVVIFAAQLVYVFRVQIAERVPALRPVLENMCATLDCTVPYARQIEMIVITQSSLQQDPGEGDAETDDVLLQFTLRNVHDGPQEWPTLVLDLKDFSGALIARKHLSKHDYLPAAMVDQPFPANTERTVALPLTMQGLQVNGYQLTAFFP